MLQALCSRQHFPLTVYFVLSGTPGLMWAYQKLGLVFAVELAIPGLLIALGLQRLVERGMPAASADGIARLSLRAELGYSARGVLEAAVREASNRGHRYVGTEHLLLALAGERSGAPALFDDIDIDSRQLLSALEFILGAEKSPTAEAPALTPRAIAVLEIAASAARQAGRSSIESEDLLAAIMQEGQGVSAGILRGLGAQPRDLREAT